jgi:hypothetical protein
MPYDDSALAEAADRAERNPHNMAKRWLSIWACLYVAGMGPSQAEAMQSFTGDLRADATFTSCGF